MNAGSFWRAGTSWHSAIIVAVLLSLIAGLAALHSPRHNWDTVGYVASLYAADGLSGPRLTEATYQDIRRSVNPDAFQTIIGQGSPEGYAAEVHADPVALTQQLPFYSIRVAYLATARVISLTDTTYTQALRWTEVFYGTLCCLLIVLLFWLAALPTWLALPVSLSAGLLGLVQLTTPDVMAAAGVLALAACAISCQRLAMLTLAALLPLIRTDLIVLSGLLCAWDGRRHRPRPLAGAAALVVAIVLYEFINIRHDNYGYLTILNFTFFGFDPYPARLSLETDVMPYVSLYLGAADRFVETALSGFYLLGTMAVFLRGRLSGNARRLTDVHGVLLVFLVAHLLLFPAYFPRFFFPVLMTNFLVLLCLARELSQRPARVAGTERAD